MIKELTKEEERELDNLISELLNSWCVRTHTDFDSFGKPYIDKIKFHISKLLSVRDEHKNAMTLLDGMRVIENPLIPNDEIWIGTDNFKFKKRKEK